MDFKLLTSSDLVRLLNVSEKTLANWRYRGLIPYIRLNGGLVRYRAAEIAAWIENQAV
jgi:predicted site-specific integrase-resolvase